MPYFSKKVSLRSVDPDKLKIEKSVWLREGYDFELELDSIPDPVWVQIFERERQASPNPLKGPVSVAVDKLEVTTSPDEIKGKIEWVKGLVDSTNKGVEKYNEQVMQKIEADEQKRLREPETIKKMREALKK
jgi:hypothetical protein